MAETKRKKKGKQKKGQGRGKTTETKNEYEIWSEFTEQIAKLASNEAKRLKDVAAAMKPGKAAYTVGDYLQDQLKNKSKLLDAYLKAAKNL